MPLNLLDYDADSLAILLQPYTDKPFRATQLLKWIHQRGESDFKKMTDLAKSLQNQLALEAEVRTPRLISEHISKDGSIKWLLDASAGNGIETVFIPEENRGTLCISSQVGCMLSCGFCATGRQGFNRNLSTGEIIGQLWWANQRLSIAHTSTPLAARRAPKPISNVVMMGMGEPLANFDNVVKALRLMLDEKAYGLSRRRITLSTAGLVPAIDRLRDTCPVALAISLHAPNDTIRDQIVPLNKKYPLHTLFDACRRYLQKAPRPFITFEYVMLDGVNDQVQHAKQLLNTIENLPCKFNLIPFNPFQDAGYRTSCPETLWAFRDILSQAGYVVTIRKTRGRDIAAACGQLAGKVHDRTRRRIRLHTLTAPLANS